MEEIKDTENTQTDKSWEEESPIEDVIITCSKHGLINKAYRYARYFTFQEDPDNKGKFIAYDHNAYWCIACMDEMFHKAIENGDAGKVTAKIVWKEDAYKKMQQMKEESKEDNSNNN